MQEAERTASCLGVKRLSALAVSKEIGGPLLVGIFRPMVVFPAPLLIELPRASLRMILAHEMAHIKRRDLISAWFCTMIECVLFFHPMVWLAKREWRFAQEVACDELAIRGTESNRSDYAAMLLDVVCRNKQEPQAMVVSMVETKRSLERRIIAMKKMRSMSRRRVLMIWAGLILLTGVGVVPWRLIAQNPAPRPDAAKLAEAESAKGDKAQEEELSRLRAENDRLKEELRIAKSARVASLVPEDIATFRKLREHLSTNIQEHLAGAVELLQRKQTELDNLLARYTEAHPLVVQKMVELDKLRKAQAEISKQLAEISKSALTANKGLFNEGKRARSAPKNAARTSEQRALLVEEVELAEKQLEMEKKRLETGTGSAEESARAVRELYATRRELARLDGDNGELRRVAEEAMRLVEQQLAQVKRQIEVGTLPIGADIELRKELLRLKRELIDLPAE